MSNRIVITKEVMKEKEYRITALFEDNRLAEVDCESLENDSLLGNIYVGKIKQIVPKINAAFIEIAPGQMTYLPLDDVKKPWMTKQLREEQLTEQDEIVVQVTKEAVKTKVPTVSTNLIFKGNALAITTENKKLGVSQKLDKETRKHLKELFAEKKDVDFGLIIRTIAGNYSNEQLFAEFNRILEMYRQMEQGYKHRTCYSCLYHAPFSYIANVKEKFSYGIEKIVTDEKEIYEELLAEFAGLPSEIEQGISKEQIVFYEDNALSLSALYGLKHKLKEALQERVWLKSGAYLVIQPTEALTVIDVNSGKCMMKDKQKDFYLKVNLEAAEEIARQLRLRNISGICIVDFINMDTKDANAKLVSELKKHLAKDFVPAVFIDFTKLGLAEITRKKVKKPLWEQV